MIPSEILGSIIYDRNSCASVSQIPLAGGKYARLCYFPVMKNYSVGSLDKIFFHENRHVVESDGLISGFTTAGTRDYFLINELITAYESLFNLTNITLTLKSFTSHRPANSLFPVKR